MVKSMKHPTLSYITVIAIIGLSFALSGHVAQPTLANFSANSNPPLHASTKLMQATADGKRTDVIVYANGYADLSSANELTTKEEKTRFVFNTLFNYANTAQTNLRRDLDIRGMSYSILWINNSIWIKQVDRSTIQWLQKRNDVAQISLDDHVKFESRDIEASSELLFPENKEKINNFSSIEWGVQRVHAPEAWAMGYRGQNIVIAGLDTGIKWNHPAIKNRYRGWNGVNVNHNYNWFDSVGTTPYWQGAEDDNGHGTHTIGTVLGDDKAGNQIGVAPDSRWIGCRNMNQGVGTVALYITCFQFALAPTDGNGRNPDPAQSADITTNSWGCSYELVEVGCEVASALVPIAQTLRDAGVMIIASAGNGTGYCGTINNAPGMLDQAFTVGATNISNDIAGFSERGPSTLTGNLKPDLVGPGVNVRSSTGANEYRSTSGTSMAAPHVAGVTALLWSAAPWLRGQINETEAILRHTAQPLTTTAQTCGGIPGTDVPNNTYGYGLVDATKAINKALNSIQIISTTEIINENTNNKIDIIYTLTNKHLTLPMRNVVISATIPANATLISTSSGAQISNGNATWTVPLVAVGATEKFTLQITSTSTNIQPNLLQVVFGGVSLTQPSLPLQIGPTRLMLPYVHK